MIYLFIFELVLKVEEERSQVITFISSGSKNMRWRTIWKIDLKSHAQLGLGFLPLCSDLRTYGQTVPVYGNVCTGTGNC